MAELLGRRGVNFRMGAVRAPTRPEHRGGARGESGPVPGAGAAAGLARARFLHRRAPRGLRWAGERAKLQEWCGAALTGVGLRRGGCLIGGVVAGTTSAAAGRTTCEAALFGVGDSAGDQLTGNTVRH